MTWRYVALLVTVLVIGMLGLAVMAGPADTPVGSRDVTHPLVDPFTVILRDGHVAAVGVALVLPAGDVPSSPVADAGPHDDPTAQPEAPEDATVREVVSEVLAGATRDDVLSRRRRERLERRVLRRVRARTHPAAKAVFFTDVAVK